MAKNYFDRYIWLIGTISRHGHIPFKEISDLWETCSLNDRHGEPLSNRTFFNHLDAIFDTFGIEITMTWRATESVNGCWNPWL